MFAWSDNHFLVIEEIRYFWDFPRCTVPLRKVSTENRFMLCHAYKINAFCSTGWGQLSIVNVQWSACKSDLTGDNIDKLCSCTIMSNFKILVAKIFKGQIIILINFLTTCHLFLYFRGLICDGDIQLLFQLWVNLELSRLGLNMVFQLRLFGVLPWKVFSALLKWR